MEPGPPCMARGRHSTWEQGTQWLHGQRPALGSCWAPGASIPSMPARPSLFQRIARRDKPSPVSNAKKYVGELLGSHQGCQVLFRTSRWNVGLLLRRCSGKVTHIAMVGQPLGFSRVTAGFSSYDGDFRLPLVLGQGSPITFFKASRGPSPLP